MIALLQKSLIFRGIHLIDKRFPLSFDARFRPSMISHRIQASEVMKQLPRQQDK